MQTWDTNPIRSSSFSLFVCISGLKQELITTEKNCPLFPSVQVSLDETRDTSHWHNEGIAISCPRAGLDTLGSQWLKFRACCIGGTDTNQVLEKKGFCTAVTEFFQLCLKEGGMNKDPLKTSGCWRQWIAFWIYIHRPTTHWHHSLQTWLW